MNVFFFFDGVVKEDLLRSTVRSTSHSHLKTASLIKSITSDFKKYGLGTKLHLITVFPIKNTPLVS